MCERFFPLVAQLRRHGMSRHRPPIGGGKQRLCAAHLRHPGEDRFRAERVKPRPVISSRIDAAGHGAPLQPPQKFLPSATQNSIRRTLIDERRIGELRFGLKRASNIDASWSDTIRQDEGADRNPEALVVPPFHLFRIGGIEQETDELGLPMGSGLRKC